MGSGEPVGYDAVVLAGGAARRLGGADKPGLSVGGTSLLERVLAAVADARRTVVVGPERATARPVRWTREEPPGGGPVAGLAAGLSETTSPVVLLLATDLPFLGSGTVHGLLEALEPGVDAAMAVDADGRDQPLLAAYRVDALRDALARNAPEGFAGVPLRRVLGGLAIRRVPDPEAASFDCDTWEDLAQARARSERGGT
jgi:molybdopterin-guanine dinucleotide biosynthesis protein A